MSSGLAAAPARPVAVPPAGLPARLAARAAAWRTPLLALVASRLVVGLAGALGVSALPLHDPAAAAQARATLGPVGNLLAASADRFDAGYYLAIAAHGFGAPRAARVAFFPLYPGLIHLLSPLGSPVLAGALISLVAFAAALVLAHRLTELELGSRAADVTVWLLALAPLSFFFTAIYTESLFLALELGAVLAARRGRWRLACGLGALATLTRPVGILIAIILGGLRWEERRRRGGAAAGRLEREDAWLLALPVALIGYLVWLGLDGRGWLAPFTAQAHWGRETVGPLIMLASAVWAAGHGVVQILAGTPIYRPRLGGPLSGPAEAIVLLGMLGIIIAALLACRRRLAWPYPAFAAAVLLVTLSSPATLQPLWSQDRFALVVFPLWMAAGDALGRHPRRLAAVLALSAGLLVFYTVQFASWSFVA